MKQIEQDEIFLDAVEEASRDVLGRAVEVNGIIAACLFDGEPHKALRNRQRVAHLAEMADSLDAAIKVYQDAAAHIRGGS